MARSVIGGFMAGALFMYFTDPNRGRRRRAVARDKFMSGLHDLTEEFDKAGRDLSNRTHGVASAVQSLWCRSETDESVLVERVRARIGRAVSHPHAIKARVDENSRVVLEGPVLRNEVDYLLKSVRSVPGVQAVASRLEIYNDPSGVSSLQGGSTRRQLSEFAQQNWTPCLRVASGAAAGAAMFASFRSGGRLSWAAAVTGPALLVRAVVNKPFRETFGIGRAPNAVNLEKTIHIDAPVEEVYAFWSNVENFPKFMAHLKEVRHLKNGRSHWVAAGPAGISIAWDAEIADQRSNELLAWRSVQSSMIATSGLVRFDKEPDGRTRVNIRMSYCPPAGVVGHAVAWLFGADPKSEMDDDLVRLKSLLETGKTRAHSARVTREQLGVEAACHPQPAL